MRHLAYFISPHGFGHAARACAVMSALHQRGAYHFEIFTQVPEWFFTDSLTGPFTYHALLTDIGIVQTSPLHEDLDLTLDRLKSFLPFTDGHLTPIVNQLSELGCAFIVSDISPLGLAVARSAGLPSALVENFTWDWIYEGYLAEAPEFQPHIDYLRGLFTTATHHLQTVPVCDPLPTAQPIAPVSRTPRQSRAQIRQRLGLDGTHKVVFLTMGGIPIEFNFLHHLRAQHHTHFLIPVPNLGALQREHNVTLLPFRSEFYHPDLMRASDAVIGKVGYSTIAEAYQAGVPFGYIQRPRFRESSFLAAFIETYMRGLELPAENFEHARWLHYLPHLLSLPRMERHEPNGAEQIAEFIEAVLL